MGLIETLHAEHKRRQLRFKKAALKVVPPAPPPPPPPPPAPAPQAQEPVPEQAAKEEVIGKLGTIPDIIINEVCKYYDVRRKDVLSRRRFGSLVRAQRMAAYMFHLTTSYTNPKIGSILNRDPSSIGVTIKNAKADDQEAAKLLEARINNLIEIRQKRERDEIFRLAKGYVQRRPDCERGGFRSEACEADIGSSETRTRKGAEHGND